MLNAFETFALNFAKALVIAAPSVAPIFVHSTQGLLIFNASEQLAGAAVQAFTPPPPVPAQQQLPLQTVQQVTAPVNPGVVATN